MRWHRSFLVGEYLVLVTSRLSFCGLLKIIAECCIYRSPLVPQTLPRQSSYNHSCPFQDGTACIWSGSHSPSKLCLHMESHTETHVCVDCVTAFSCTPKGFLCTEMNMVAFGLSWNKEHNLGQARKRWFLSHGNFSWGWKGWFLRLSIAIGISQC